MPIVGMAQPSILPAKSRRPVPALSAYLSNPGILCVLAEMKADGQLPTGTKLHSSKYLSNLIEQDHRGVKLRNGPVLGFKRFKTAVVTSAGMELLRRIHKGPFNLRWLSLKDRSAPAIWNAMLAA
jgi:hypothetical protein